MPRDIHIFIVDDHPVFRRGLRSVIESEKGMVVAGEAADGESALSYLLKHRVDVVVLDLDMPKMDGLDLAKSLAKRNIESSILILTMYQEPQLIRRARELGITGFVSKENAATEIPPAIRAVAGGKFYACPLLAPFITSEKSPTMHDIGSPLLHRLSSSEQRVLKLIAENKSTKQIAMQLLISPRTVENHRTNICSKLEIHGSHALLRFLIENKSFI